ncbi:carbohydrate ABC transporter substrate-binding protein [Amycolatopsis balhimycina DSM 5908]|uniref:Carbohydrate ABC transporter substrate-binding protein n=1 Tax=Amycolatopsis balhimycina DSM 5908 TaxID=1081091 RepID=A0A428W219_AMYBA|nr:ABC transporter substrate-binding protein [Amycolatopsis balhimycina]RSM37093.1 carbohydrate ABC transporter substrate-binding protein [Amycolatopsis balhimycina DSM 5908]
MRKIRRRLAFAVAVVLLVLTGGCGPRAQEHITLTVATFGEFGYEDLIPGYEFTHPGLTIRQVRTEQGGPYHQDLLKKLQNGQDLADVQAVEEGHLADVLAQSAKFADLAKIGPSDVKPGRWLEWKYEAGRSKDGKLVGYGTDIGPLAMCYRKDFLEAAQLPTDPGSVKTMFATWDSYFKAGEKYVKRSHGKPWFDSAAQIFNAKVNQLPVGYLNRDDHSTLETNTALKDAWDQVSTAVKQGQSAGLTAFEDDGNNGLRLGGFATKVCPAWMLGIIEQQAGIANAGKWAITDAFPDGGGNWGGSYLTVPAASPHQKEAATLAAWLTAPEQQLHAFRVSGNFPSQVEAFTSPDLLSEMNSYFGGALSGQVFVAQARKVGKPQYKGPGDGKIQEAVIAPALKSVEQGADPAAAWQQVLAGVHRLVP